MKKSVYVLTFMIIWICFTFIALTLGIRYDWPDYVHVNYGLPLVWATHTLSAISGPQDIWEINQLYLQMNIILWLGFLVMGVALILYYKKN